MTPICHGLIDVASEKFINFLFTKKAAISLEVGRFFVLKCLFLMGRN